MNWRVSARGSELPYRLGAGLLRRSQSGDANHWTVSIVFLNNGEAGAIASFNAALGQFGLAALCANRDRLVCALRPALLDPGPNR